MQELREQPMPSADDILAMDKAVFAERFRDTSVFRTGLDRLRRNAELALIQA